MGDRKETSSSSSSSSFSLPPGCRFYPSEEQLLCYYLHHKNNNNINTSSSSSPNFCDAIKDIGLYDFNPFELPRFTCFRFGYRGRKRHWYCFTERINDERETRRAGFGFWKRKGRVRDVMGNGNGGKVILGTRKRFMFYLEKCNGKRAVRTDWIMYEYALIDSNCKASFVVCRVFVKPRSRKSISQHAQSSCAEESITTVRDIGIQHDGCIIIDNDSAHGHDYVKEKSLAAGMSTRQIEEIKTHNLVKSPGRTVSANMLVDSTTAKDLISILEGDFIELDDLV